MSVTYPRAQHILRLRPSLPSAYRPAPAPDRPTAGIAVDPERRTASVLGRALDLTRLEFDLLAHLVAHPHQVHSRRQLLAAVWQQPASYGDVRTVDVHIARLRRKLGPRYRAAIATVTRVGYKLDPDLLLG